MKNLFDLNETKKMINRIDQLNENTSNQWGEMNVGQMLAHVNVAYEMVYDDKHPKPNWFKKFMLKLFVKSTVVGPKPYVKNSRTAPEFLIKGEREFQTEKKRLVDYLKKTQELGVPHFHNKESHSFGSLTKEEWNTMFYKHLDHHLTQFGV